MLTDKQITGMCKRLAYKYNSETHRDDMMQEGILACYEILADEPDAHPAKLYREAKRRMHDYLNLDTQPVTIPAHNISRRLVRDLEDTMSGDMTEESFTWLKLVLEAEDRPYDDTYGLSEEDHTEKFEEREYADYIRGVVLKTLNSTELFIVKMRYYEDMTLDEVGDILGTNRMWVSRRERDALKKLKVALCNNS